MVAALVAAEVRAGPPRIAIVPEGVEHPKWAEVSDFVDELGVTLDDWQRMVLHAALLRRGSLWAAFAVGVCAPRQNGKNGILEIRELIGPLVLGETLLIHTAHLADTSKEAFRRLDDLIDANAWLSAKVRHIWRTNGHESIEFVDGRRIRFRTRTRGGGRGFSGSPVFFDEAMFLPEVSMGAILPVISAQEDPQVWYMGSAVDQSLMEDGMVFSRVRQRAVNDADDRLAYFEWSLDVGTPNEVDDEVAGDPVSWASTNPAYGIRIMPEYVKAERQELDPRTFVVERLGVGDWPDPDATKGGLIDLAEWHALIDVESKIVGPPHFAIDVTPDRSMTSISAAGSRDAGGTHVELVDHRPGTGWVATRTAELVVTHSPARVVLDAAGPAGSLVPDLEKAGVNVHTVTTQEHGQACARFVDAVADRTVWHLDDRMLLMAIKGSVTRPLVDAWAWSRKSSSVDISPLVACTLSHWSVTTGPSGNFLEDISKYL